MKSKTSDNFFKLCMIGNESDDFHEFVAFRANQRVDLVDFFDKDRLGALLKSSTRLPYQIVLQLLFFVLRLPVCYLVWQTGKALEWNAKPILITKS